MKKFFITHCLYSQQPSYSQELDEAYLDSLPDNIRDDVLQKIDERDAQRNPVYRRASSMIDKPTRYKRFGDKYF